MTSLALRASPTLAQRWDHVQPRPWALIEAVALPLLAGLLAAVLGNTGWLSGEPGFPWAWLAPWIVTLRYGTLAGALAAAALTAFGVIWLGASFAQADWTGWAGGWIVTLILGEFADRWIDRVRRHQIERDYAHDQLQRLSRQHYTLRLSHDRLEQELLHQPLTLRAALEQLRRLGPDTSDAEAGRLLLQLLAGFAKVQQATLHRLDEAGRPEPAPLAHLGPPQPLDPNDPMVMQALRRRRLAHARDVEELVASRYRAVLPFGPDEQPQWLLVVHHLPFLALHDGTLVALQVLCDDFAALRQARLSAADVLREQPGCAADFALELQRLHRLQQRWSLPSTLGVLHADSTPAAHWLPRIAAQLRSLDLSCEPAPGRLLVVLPLTHGAGSEGFLQRIEQWLQRQGAGGLAEAGLRWRARTLDAPPAALLRWGMEDA
ncbi:PelD GGDEF domain protein [Tepidimonas alkaliphilus]|uniref:PelD GGDEF domain protein n=1 Tax=Tepidimonas alkaliphilus TaxID=2588942 RepID=A0A554W8L4_9BURK|nr:PelD GGDEF domain-containing protein [Tepidimonas alkaliphilus]TSE19901.1 PelD GGDEF domain protein [Tepidimonas alkaliphilus]